MIAVLCGSALEDEESDDERCGAEGDDDGPHSVTPSPCRVLQHAVGENGSEIEGGDCGDGFGEGAP